MYRLGPAITNNVTAVLKIAREHVEAMIAHAREDHPDEACGVIVGPEDS
ncbi:MAG TPA: Mov34/MPN/PAD-1 family protein, partial [Propionibacteriaceae bacterium]|nr:Mov34/MPN/PAD-1 family protein [Propionibacteriaceae bacterium]